MATSRINFGISAAAYRQDIKDIQNNDPCSFRLGHTPLLWPGVCYGQTGCNLGRLSHLTTPSLCLTIMTDGYERVPPFQFEYQVEGSQFRYSGTCWAECLDLCWDLNKELGNSGLHLSRRRSFSPFVGSFLVIGQAGLETWKPGQRRIYFSLLALTAMMSMSIHSSYPKNLPLLCRVPCVSSWVCLILFAIGYTTYQPCASSDAWTVVV